MGTPQENSFLPGAEISGLHSGREFLLLIRMSFPLKSFSATLTLIPKVYRLLFHKRNAYIHNSHLKLVPMSSEQQVRTTKIIMLDLRRPGQQSTKSAVDYVK